MAARLPLPYQLWLIPVAGLSAIVGLLAGLDPKLAIAASLVIAFGLIAINDLATGLVVFTLLSFLDLAPGLGGPALSFAKLTGLVLAVAWLASISRSEEHGRAFWSVHPRLTLLLLLFLAWSLLSIVWAEQLGAVVGSSGRYALNVALFAIVFEAVRTREQAARVIGALALGAAAAALYGLLAVPDASDLAYSPTAATGLNRLAGAVGDPNVLAAVLVVGLVLSLALALDRDRSTTVRATMAGVAALCLASSFLAASRGGLVALAAALLAWVVLAPRGYRGIALGAIALALAAVVYFAVLAPESVQERLGAADGGAGRTDIWKVGWRMVEDRPWIGVGGGNFPNSSVHYLLEPGPIEYVTYIVDTPAVAHNVYLEILAELGIVGLVLFAAILISSIACAERAARGFARAGDRQMQLLSRALIVALVGLLVADFFISEQYSKQLWLLLSLGPALLALAGRSGDRRAESG